MNTNNDNISAGQLFDFPKAKSNIIKVIGVGGGGGNAVNYMFNEGIKGVDYVVCNTDAQALEESPVPNKIQLGINITRGLGAGSNPEKGEKAAEDSLEEIDNVLNSNTEMVFITAGMGGGTGTGAAPVIARLAKEKGILTIGIVTIPYLIEGPRRNKQAMEGVEKLRKCVDSLIVINNNKLIEMFGDRGIEDNFILVNQVLLKAAKGMAEVISKHFTINIDMEDARTVLKDGGSAIMGSASAEGEDRALKAITEALNSPLLNDNRIVGAKNALALVLYGNKQPLQSELELILKYIQKEAGGSLQTNLIYGAGRDESMNDDSLHVIVITTGFDADQQHKIVNTEEPKIIHVLELDSDESQPVVRDLTEQTTQPIVNQPVWSFSPPVEIPQNQVANGYSLSDLFNIWVDCEVLSANEFRIIEKSADNAPKTTYNGSTEQFTWNAQNVKETQKNHLFELNNIPHTTRAEVQPNQEEKIVELSDDYPKFEKALLNAQPQEAEQNEFSIFIREEEEETTPAPVMAGQQMRMFEEEEQPNLDPINNRISEVMSKRSGRLQDYNHKFQQTNGYTADNHSRSSISQDSFGDFQIRKNNSFLHDNVD